MFRRAQILDCGTTIQRTIGISSELPICPSNPLHCRYPHAAPFTPLICVEWFFPGVVTLGLGLPGVIGFTEG